MEIKQLIRETKQLEKEIVAQKAKYDENRRKIQTYFDKHDIKDLEVEKTENTNQMVASKIERAYIDYDVEKLKETFDKEILNEIILKSYSIIDIEALKSMVKKAGMSAKSFRECLQINEEVDKKRLTELYNTGEITLKKLKGCYSARIVKSISVREINEKGGKD